MTKTLSASEVKTRFYELLKAVGNRGDEVVVTREGKPAAIIMNFEEFEQLMETLDVLSDPKTVKRLREAREYIKKGAKLLTHEEVFGEPLR
ncbi:MAG: type II toxin-antitoxin system Phd/YefM family antitoxin [Candidatus Omnitrophica bacterium]|nr:type II toxin-antitoxin system Phd/YefM family antitoxin [Candidatus Omnitrophota bacterium]